MYKYLLAMILTGFSYSLVAAPVSFNDFFVNGDIDISADGTTATFYESLASTEQSLINDPFFGDPEVIVAEDNTFLNFHYVFTLGDANESDAFSARLFDWTTGDFLGASFEFFVTDSSEGDVSFDLTELVGMGLGLQLDLLSLPGDGGISSLLVLSDMEMKYKLTGPVALPLPTPLLLITLGGLFAWSLRRQTA